MGQEVAGMDDIFIYVDDVLVSTATAKQHNQVLHKVLQVLVSHNIPPTGSPSWWMHLLWLFGQPWNNV